MELPALKMVRPTHLFAVMAYYCNVEKPDFGAQWDFQLTVTFLFPK